MKRPKGATLLLLAGFLILLTLAAMPAADAALPAARTPVKPPVNNPQVPAKLPALVLAAPTNLTATATANRVDLTWQHNSDTPATFIIERKVGTGQYAVLTTTATGVKYTDTDVQGGVAYSYRMKAYLPQGTYKESLYSNEATATVPAVQQTGNAPTNLTATATATRIDLMWQHNSDAPASFIIERKIGTGQYAVLTTTATGVKYADTTVQGGVAYAYRMKAYFPQGTYKTSLYSNEASATVPTFQQAGGASITAKLDTGQPLYGATVQAMQNGLPVGTPVTTRVDGKISIGGLAPGTYQFKADFKNTSQTSNFVTITSGQTAEVVITYATGSAAFFAKSDTAPLQYVRIFAPSGGTQWTTPDGKAVITGLLPGTYQFTATLGSLPSQTSPPVVVTAGQTTPETTFTFSNTIDIVVKTAAGAPIQGAGVAIVPNVPTVTTGADGVARFAHLDLSQTTYTFKVTYNYLSATTPPIPVGRDKPVVVTVNNLSGVGSLLIKARWDGGLPAPLISYRVDMPHPYSGNADIYTGDAYIRDMPAGSYPFTFTYISPDRDTVETVTKTITVPVGPMIEATVTFTSGNSAITVTHGGNPLPGATVTGMMYPYATPQALTTNNQGVVNFTGLPTGKWKFTITKEGYQQATLDVTVTKGATAAVTVPLAQY